MNNDIEMTHDVVSLIEFLTSDRPEERIRLLEKYARKLEKLLKERGYDVREHLIDN